MLPVPSIDMDQTARISLRVSKLSKSAGTETRGTSRCTQIPLPLTPPPDASRIAPARTRYLGKAAIPFKGKMHARPQISKSPGAKRRNRQATAPAKPRKSAKSTRPRRHATI
jgi:hypothetical protein